MQTLLRKHCLCSPHLSAETFSKGVDAPFLPRSDGPCLLKESHSCCSSLASSCPGLRLRPWKRLRGTVLSWGMGTATFAASDPAYCSFHVAQRFSIVSYKIIQLSLSNVWILTNSWRRGLIGMTLGHIFYLPPQKTPLFFFLAKDRLNILTLLEFQDFLLLLKDHHRFGDQS